MSKVIGCSYRREGVPLTGESLALAVVYQRVWANLEDYYWKLEPHRAEKLGLLTL